MSAGPLLPPGFSALEPFVARWSVTGSARRAALRGETGPAEREAFYEAAAGYLAPALDHLDGKGLSGMDPADERLMNLMLSLAHVALAVEQQQGAEARHAQDREHMRITRTSAGA